MSAGLSPSGVASLRARFEQKDESTSPPSRGRSPAASLSVSGGASRPISKVRTSFVSVEPSGQMGDLDASEELGHKGHISNNDGTLEPPMNGAGEQPKMNGIESTPQKSVEKEESATEGMPTWFSPRKTPVLPKSSETVNGAPATVNPDKPKSTAEEKSDALLPSDPKEAPAVSDEAPQEGEAPPLGSILKGSPFEQGEKEAETSNDPEIEKAAEPVQALEHQTTSPKTLLTNDKPKEGSAQKEAPQSSTKKSPRPPVTGKKSAAQLASSAVRKSVNKPQTSTLSSPTTPKNTATPSKPAVTENISPKSATLKEPKKEAIGGVKKSTVERPNQPTVAPKTTTAASKRVPRPPEKKAGPTSPPSFTKPRPRSPTRPVRLPSSATAPTAASAAKVDAAPAATAKTRSRGSSNPTSQRQKPARTSLPVGSKPAERANDKPKSRLSTVSSNPSGGSFLDRMMRPTQSSSQKTHEKVEAKSPPRKTNGLRPKRKSDESEKAKNEEAKAKADKTETRATPSPPHEAKASSPLIEAPVESSESPKVNGADKGIDGDASTSAAPLPLQ